MNYVLYYSPGAASFAVHWMLIELGAPFETIVLDLKANDQKADAYRRLNPAGRVPTLIVDGAPVAESTALLLLLADRHPAAGLAPAVGDPGRAVWLEAMVFLANTVAPAMRDWFYADQDGEAADADAVRRLAMKRIEAAWDRLDGQLADGRQQLCGGGVTTVDFLAVMLMRWSRNMPHPATSRARLRPYVSRMRARPGYAEVCRREGLTDWLNP